MTYIITGNITYSTSANRTTALAAINAAVLANAVITNWDSGGILGTGVTTSGTTIVRFSLQCPDFAIDIVREALRVAWTSAARTSAQVGVAKVT